MTRSLVWVCVLVVLSRLSEAEAQTSADVEVVESPTALPPTAPGASQCIRLSADDIAAAKPMTWVNKQTFVRGFASVRLLGGATQVRDEWYSSGPPHLVEYESLTAMQAQARERASSLLRQPSDHDLVRLELELRDGRVRTYGVPHEVGMIMEDDVLRARGFPAGDATTIASYEVPLVMTPNIRAIRVLLHDAIIAEFVRPAHPLKIEALVLSNMPLRIALRARGEITNPTVVQLREELADDVERMAYYNGSWLRPNDPGMYPCWLLLPDEPGSQGDQGAPVVLRIFDEFYEWKFRTERGRSKPPRSNRGTASRRRKPPHCPGC